MNLNLKKSEIKIFLELVEKNSGKIFNDEAKKLWLSAPESNLNDMVAKLYDRMGLTPIVINSIEKAITNIRAANTLASKTTKYEETPSTPLPPKNNNGITYLIILISIIGLSYVGYQVYGYSKLKKVYCLAARVAIRVSDQKEADKVGKAGQMDLFGKYRNDTGGIETTYESLFTIHGRPPVNGYIPVFREHSFLEWLSDKSPIGYVHKHMVTESLDTLQMYQHIFENIAEDYSTLSSLTLPAKRAIVAAIKSDTTLENLQLAKSECNDTLSGKRYSSFAWLQGASNFVIFRLTDGIWYIAETDSNDKVIAIQSMKYGVNSQPLNEEYKFVVTRLTKQKEYTPNTEIIAYSCNNNYSFKSAYPNFGIYYFDRTK